MHFTTKYGILALIRPVESLLQTKGLSLCVLTIYAMNPDEVKPEGVEGDEATVVQPDAPMTPATEGEEPVAHPHVEVEEGTEEAPAA